MIVRHFTRCFLAGVVALLPVFGTALTVVWLEVSIAGSWLAEQPFYFPGLGLLAVLACIYVTGLFVTTWLGRWLWRGVDSLLEGLPALGAFYQSLKQILGYGEGEAGVFERVVLLPSVDTGGDQLGLVTQERVADGVKKLVVFVPGAPNPTTGRLVVVPASSVAPTDMKVSEALRALVSLGKTELDLTSGR